MTRCVLLWAALSDKARVCCRLLPWAAPAFLAIPVEFLQRFYPSPLRGSRQRKAETLSYGSILIAGVSAVPAGREGRCSAISS